MRSEQTKEHIMSKRLIKLLPLAAALSFGGLAFSGLASAHTNDNPPSVVVKYGDLDLSTPNGVAALHSRLNRAAKQVCSPFESRVLGLRERYDQCIADAVADAVNTVGNTNLSLYHRYGKRADIVASN
jgi:UrcA family protein